MFQSFETRVPRPAISGGQGEQALPADPIRKPLLQDPVLVRSLDVAVAIAAIAALAPLMLAIALLIRMSSKGPVVFRQQRLGQNGELFTCYKFRTMYLDAEQWLGRVLDSCEVARDQWATDQKLRSDPRIIPVGHTLRRWSLDELPQLFNVLQGNMSIVGPRPIVPGEAARYGRYISHYCAMRPGLTGLWQISGRNETTYRRRIACDIVYSRSKCAWMDMRIMARTVPVMLTARGAY